MLPLSAAISPDILKRRNTMSKSNIVVPEAKDALERFKMEAANEVGVQNHIKKYLLK